MLRPAETERTPSFLSCFNTVHSSITHLLTEGIAEGGGGDGSLVDCGAAVLIRQPETQQPSGG